MQKRLARLGAARPALGGKRARRFPNPKLLFMVQEPLREVRGDLPQRRRSWLARGRDLPMAAAPARGELFRAEQRLVVTGRYHEMLTNMNDRQIARLDVAQRGAFHRVFREHRDLLGHFGYELLPHGAFNGGASDCIHLIFEGGRAA